MTCPNLFYHSSLSLDTKGDKLKSCKTPVGDLSPLEYAQSVK